MSERPLRVDPPSRIPERNGVVAAVLVVLVALAAALLIVTHAKTLGPVRVDLQGLGRELMRHAFPDRSIPGPERRARPPTPQAHPAPPASEPGR